MAAIIEFSLSTEAFVLEETLDTRPEPHRFLRRPPGVLGLLEVDGSTKCETSVSLAVCPESGMVPDVPLWG